MTVREEEPGGPIPDLSPITQTETYTYGAAGHLEEVDRGANVIDYIPDAAGRLSGLDRLGEMANFTYDGRSFLLQAKRPPGPSDQATTDPTYSSEGLLYCLARQEDAAATPETVNYFYFAGRPVAQRHNNGATDTWTFLTTDHLGTPVFATNLAGEEIWWGPFEPFGRDYGTGATGEKLFLRLPGQWDDGRWAKAALGADLYYNVHRWYEHGSGRYSRVDPFPTFALTRMNMDPVRATSLLPFTYAISAPTSLVDLLGLCTSCDDCPSGQWYYNGVGVSLAFLGGWTRSAGTYTCIGKEQVKVNTTIACSVSGPILSVGIGLETNPSGSVARACNRNDFFARGGGPSMVKGSLATAGPFSVVQVPTPGNVQRTYGVGKSIGLGGAYLECQVTRRDGFQF